MKSRYKIVFLLIALSMTGILTNCSDDPEGAAVINYVRITDPASSDSLLIAAGQGQMVVIIGKNLQNTQQVWFNDQRAALTTTFVTSTSIIVRIPSKIPEIVTNELKLVFANGESMIYDFTVDISKPLVRRMKNEYVKTGDEATFYGDYFYAPLVVTFSGGIEAEIVSREDQELTVKVPDGVEPGPVTITSNFGVTETDLWFRDNRNLFGSMDVTTFGGWWHGSTFIAATDPVIEPVNNKFLRINNNLGAGQWFEFFVGTGGDMALETKKIPDEAILHPEDYSLKFELNTLASLAGAKIHMYVGNDMPGERTAKQYIWQPNINTGGVWETISVPFKDVLSRNPGIKVDPNGYGISFWFWEGAAVNANFALDNARVVPNVID